tara:strand:+ start:964 stop:1206 length:243 start_codon:yes stop_codon:yes gene_type:complete
MKKSYLTPDDLTKDQIEKLKKRNPQLEDFLKEANKKPKQYNFTKEQVRQQAIKVLNTIALLSSTERARVLDHARKMNDVC